MFKNLLLTSLLLFGFIGVIYPSRKENTKIFDYCYSLEKIISSNSIQTSDFLSFKIKSISQDIAKFGISRTKGDLIKKIIDKYKTSKNSFILNSFPNDLYCLSGYWIEKFKPGTFESIIYEKNKKTINEFKDYKDEVDGLLNDINSEYKIIEKELNSIF